MKRFVRFLRSPLSAGIVIGILLVILIRGGNSLTSTDSFCELCHVHPQAITSWKQSTHFASKSGMIIHCVECHLPPGGLAYFTQKTRLGVRDALGKLLKDKNKFDWEARSSLEHAKTYTFRNSCLRCHPNLFPLTLTEKGDEAHLYYTRKSDEIRCINCHLHVGHFDPGSTGALEFGLTSSAERENYTEPAVVESFEDFTEFIPGSPVSFEMVAIPGGTFTIGSPASERFRRQNEGPERSVQVSPFWMGRTEVTWDEFEVWYRETAGPGRTDTRQLFAETYPDVDAVTGATPPYGNPDQGWGKGDRPAITMTYHAATVYCEWLSEVTGKKYRLPTEAEWEYACRGGTSSPYFFEGDPGKFTRRRLWNRLFGTSTSVISEYVIYSGSGGGRTQSPSEVEPNPYRLLNMAGNVKEFCLDWYLSDVYSHYPEGTAIIDPTGPETGTEHVIRGGSFRSDAVDVRSAAREQTRTDTWLVTDPQIPKSIWWYSDCIDVGFRVVCEYDLPN